MGCTKSISISATGQDQFTPLDNAVYVPSMDKILGTMENHIVKFNATTGAYESSVKAISPLYGPMGICLVNGVPWISCWNDPSVASSAILDAVRKDIFRLNTTTLEAILPGIGLPAKAIFTPPQWETGPTMIRGSGDLIYFLYVAETLVYIGFIDSTNVLTFQTANATDGLWCEQFGTDGTNLYTADPRDQNLYRHNAALLTRDAIFVGPDHYPVGIEYCGGFAYAVCGTKWLLIGSNFSTDHFYQIDLETISGTTGIKPIRLRYNSSNGNIYIPVQNKDGVIVLGASSTQASTTVDLPFTIQNPGTPTVVNLTGPFTGLVGDTIYVAGYGAFEVLIIAGGGNDLTVDNIDAGPILDIVNGGTVVSWFTQGSATFKTGFDSPVDVVFTPTKAFAVQSGLVGLREIT